MDDSQDETYKFTLDFCNGVSTCNSINNYTAAVSTYLRKSILKVILLLYNGMGWWAISTYACRRCRFTIPDTAGLPLTFKKRECNHFSI